MGATTPDQIVELLDAAFQARDSAAIADFYEEDAIFANPPMWTAVGRAEIIDRVNELLEATDALDVAYDPPVKFAVVGDYAFKHYTSVTTVTLPNGASQEMATRTTTIAHRGNDGNWRYIVDHKLFAVARGRPAPNCRSALSWAVGSGAVTRC